MPAIKEVTVSGEEVEGGGAPPAPNAIGEGWDDYVVSGLNSKTRGANDPTLAELRNGIYLYAFTGVAGVNEVYASVHILHDWKVGADMYPHIHWAHNIAAPSGDVVWQIDYTIAKGFDQETFSAPTTLTIQQTAGPQYTHQIIESSTAIPAADIEADAVVLMRIYRDSAHGNDTFANDAFLIQSDLHYESDGNRTNEKASPFTKIA